MLDRLLRALVAPLVAGLTMASVAQAAEDPSFLTISAGGFDIFDDGSRPPNYDGHNYEALSFGNRASEFGLQYRSNSKLWIFKPHLGAMVTTDGAYYGYGGVLVDVYFGNRWVLTPTIAAGYYNEGDGKRLGSTIEFRSGLELAYRFDNRMRLGAGLYHISNASIGDRNPGVESATVNFSLPTSLLLGGGK